MIVFLGEAPPPPSPSGRAERRPAPAVSVEQGKAQFDGYGVGVRGRAPGYKQRRSGCFRPVTPRTWR